MSILEKAANKAKTSTTVRTSTSTETKQQAPPKGATILESNISTNTEEIENGWLICKNFDGRYTTKGDTDSYGHYFSYSKKWFSKTNPLTVTLNDKTLADAFDDDENIK